MEQVICKHGHFYDGDKYKDCPHCAAGMKPVVPSVFTMVRDASQDGKGKSEEKTTDRLKKMLFGGRTGSKAKDIPGNLNREQYSREIVSSGASASVNTSGAYHTGQGISKIEPKNLGNSYPATELIREPESTKSSFQTAEAIEEPKSTGNSCQKTEYVRPEKSEERYDEDYTIGFFSTSKNIEPPVGYLICVEGKDYGNGFPLKSGNNSIGRSASMDVAVMDPKVSREKQAYVMYEPHKREFFLKPGDSAGLCYLNDEVALEPKKLKAHDVILLGDTKLMLIPVCDEKFSW